jgi:hypothetical protein
VRTEGDYAGRGCTGGQELNAGRDAQTLEITEGIAQRILERTGLSPYVVIAQFHRKHLDVNRKEHCAFVDDSAKIYYDEYHTRIAGFVAEVLAQNNHGFLFDIHGARDRTDEPADIYLGTGNGATLRPWFDRKHIFFTHGLHGLLSASHRGRPSSDGAAAEIEEFVWRVSPANAEATELGDLNGGYTVRHYSSQINCIQIEITNAVRTNSEKRALLIDDLSFALTNFVRRHAIF